MNRMLPWAWLIVSALAYAALLYTTPRTAFGQLLLWFGLLFVGYAWMMQQGSDTTESSPWLRPRWIIAIGLGFRLIALFALPEMSDDYFRFVWDGRLLAAGENPFDLLPSAYLAQPEQMLRIGLDEALFSRLNSPEYFTIYPPVLQAIFWLGAWLSPNSIYGHVLVMKSVVFLAEAGTLLLLLRLLKAWGKPLHWLGWYAWNPLVIVELIGNLHFEALMIFGLIWALWEWQQGRWLRSALPFAIAVGSKLLPLMLMPLMIRRLGWAKAIFWGLAVAGLCLLMAIPLFDLETVQNLLASVDLYFRKFEFNASVYYLVRWAGFQAAGYNIIQQAGPILALLTVGGICALAFLQRPVTIENLPKAMFWALGLYLLLASIVHPWYTTTLVALACLSRFRFAMVWSGMAVLSYFAYRTSAYEESLWLVALEYGVVLACLGWELWGSRRQQLGTDRK